MAVGGPPPDPDKVADLAEFIEALRQLRLWAGAPSYQALAKHVGPLLPVPQKMSRNTVYDVFGPPRRRLDFDLVIAIVRALGVDGIDVERWRQACVRVHAAAKNGGSSGALRQLPAYAATFTGRQDALRRLVEISAPSTGTRTARTVVVSAIEGMAGVGKTQLALRAAYELVHAGRFADVQLYVNLRGFDPDQAPSDPAAVLAAFLRQLGVPAAAVPESLEERSAMFRDRLYGQRALVVLDNAADEEQIRQLVPAGPENLVLVTSRRHLSGLEDARLIVLDVFTPQEGVALLEKVAGAARVEAEPAAAAEVVELCGGLPLAVALAASRLRSRPAWTLADLAQRLRTNRIANLGDGARSPWPVFELSYTGLAEPARHVLRLLALHPGRDATAASAAALANCEETHAQATLETLVDEHLLQQKAPGRYEFHDLLRIYAQQKATADLSAEDRAAARERVLRWYAVAANAALTALDPGGPAIEFPAEQTHGYHAQFVGTAQASAWFGQEIANLFDAVEVADRHRFGLASFWISAAMHRYLLNERRAQDVVRLSRFGLDGARMIGNRLGEAWTLTHLVFAESGLGRLEEAEARCIEAIEIYRSVGDLASQARTLSYLSYIDRGSGRPELALERAYEALSIIRLSGNRVGRAIVLSNLAVCLHAVGRAEDALEHLIEARETLDVTDNALRFGVIIRNIGFTHLVLKRHRDAEAAFAEALGILQDPASAYYYVECLHGLARAQFAQGDVDRARQTVARAETVLAGFDDETAARFRQNLESSPIRYDENTEIDPKATATT